MGRRSGVQVQIEFTHEFKRNLRTLSKKYRFVRSDVQPVIERLQNGEVLGEEIPRVGFSLFKVRIRNSDIRRGKRSGYRLIYYLRTPSKIVLITILSKLDQEDISSRQIRKIVIEHGSIQWGSSDSSS